jgi:hypothetical protein
VVARKHASFGAGTALVRDFGYGVRKRLHQPSLSSPPQRAVIGLKDWKTDPEWLQGLQTCGFSQTKGMIELVWSRDINSYPNFKFYEIESNS